MKAIYSSMCPVCGSDLNLEEVEKGYCGVEDSPLCEDDESYVRFIRFFTRAIGEPRSIQKTWAKRILRGESFAAVAPTGVGKTSFGVAISTFLALEGKRSYIILPTTLLLEQVLSNAKKYAENAGVSVSFNGEGKGQLSVAYYHGKLKKKEKERFFEVIKKADILITTTQFLSRHFKKIKQTERTFDFIFVDDVDAILKASKNVEKLLNLLGFYYEKGWKEGEKTGCLMVSTATVKKGKKAELFRKLLNFDIGSSAFTIRNIEDIAIGTSDLGVLVEILEKMGGGGLIYTRNSAEMQKVFELLKGRFKVGIVSGKKNDFESFKKSELDFLIGSTHYYGSLVRGIDLPERVRYAIFLGCPSFRIRIEDIEDLAKVNDRIVRILLMVLRRKKEFRKFLDKFDLTNFERIIWDKNPERIIELRRILKEILKESESGEAPDTSDVIIRESELIIPDIRTYIQGSGRTSRLFSGGITKGVSFILESDEKVLRAFVRRASYYDLDVSVKKIEEVEFERLKREIDESRRMFARKGEYNLIKPTLFIVESPTKARHISRFFGKPSIRFLDSLVVYEVPTSEYILLITASLGHVTDLITNRGFHGVEIQDSTFVPVFSSIKRCLKCGYQFTLENETCPRCGCGEINDSRKRIDALRILAYETGRVIIGTDPDSEGEKIAWDLKNLLSGCGEVKRAEFHEVTKKAVAMALSNLREIDEDLVKAQIVRRIEDRWIGFVLSQKLQEVFKDKNLSAGRAQTPVLGWILKRTRENREKKVVAILDDLDLSIELSGDKSPQEVEFEVEIGLVGEEVAEITPLPPYTTDMLLRDANRILKLNASMTMKVAQTLFESGLITYHRTDSTRVSDLGFRIAKEYLGDDFFPREWYAEGAHECIRPTRPVDRVSLQRLIYEGVIRAEELDRIHFSLYDLIFRRFMASQCKNLKVRIGRYRIKYDNKVLEEERILSAEGKAYEVYKSVVVKRELPLGKTVVKAKIKEVPKAPLYSEAEVIQLMKERGIGRPSTYATITERLFERRYVFEKNGRIRGTKRGFSIFRFLSENYSDLVSEKRTTLLEEKMDKIARGELDYMEALNELYEEIKSIG